ncbi:unnamed protein product [Moneuplotes crassus]|uniref:Uncharacterized protein n=1 Tax=Euplotes crassus TaxID=5936 RepID=A0AAD1U9Z5_EUPCR|nr:unnamed protein product [Moneuplotes crassus]
MENRSFKNLIIQNTDFYYPYLIMQARQLFQIDQETLFALKIRICPQPSMKDTDKSESYKFSENNTEIGIKSEFGSTNKFDKVVLIKDDSILAKVRAGKNVNKRAKTQAGRRIRNKNKTPSCSTHDILNQSTNTTNDTSQVDVHIVTDPELIKKSLTWKMANSNTKENSKLQDIKSAYRKPIRLVKLKIDNTQEFKIHPMALSKFVNDAIKDQKWKDKLIQYHIAFSKNSLNLKPSWDFQRENKGAILHKDLTSLKEFEDTKRVITDYFDSLDSILQNIEKSIFPLAKTALQMGSNSILKDVYNLESTTLKKNNEYYGNTKAIPSDRGATKIFKKLQTKGSKYYGDLLSVDSETTNHRSIDVGDRTFAGKSLENCFQVTKKKSISKISSRYSRKHVADKNYDHFRTSVGFGAKFKMNLRKIRQNKRKESKHLKG